MNTNCCNFNTSCNSNTTCNCNRSTTFNNNEDNKHEYEHMRDEICIDGILYKFRLNEIAENVSELVVVSCQQPTLVMCVAEIRKKENCCMNMTYFQATINSHCVEIIQDCSLKEIIECAIRIFVDNNEFLCSGRGRRRGRGRIFSGFIF